MAYRVHVYSKRGKRPNNELLGLDDEIQVLCKDYVLRDGYLVLKQAQTVTMEQSFEDEFVYISLDSIQSFTVNNEVIDQ